MNYSFEEYGLNVSSLLSKTRLEIHTLNSIYDVCIIEAKHVTIQGGMIPNGEIRFNQPKDAIFVGSSLGKSMIKIDWLGLGRKLEFIIDEQPIQTSPVLKIIVRSHDGSWDYTIDES